MGIEDMKPVANPAMNLKSILGLCVRLNLRRLQLTYARLVLLLSYLLWLSQILTTCTVTRKAPDHGGAHAALSWLH